MNRAEAAALYEAHINPVLGRFWSAARVPMEMRGEGVKVFDEDGRAYLDFAAGFGVFHVGHGHPKVRAAMLEQLGKLAFAPAGLMHEPMAQLVSRLAALTPGDLNRVYLVNSGSEAIDLARRIVHAARPRRTHLVTALKGYHGKTVGALGITGQDFIRTGFEPLGAQVRFVPFADVGAMRDALAKGDVAAVFLEPVLGGGYITVPPPGYLSEVRALCDQAGTLLVADEVQTGFGRTGKMFGVEHDAVVPDLLVLSKGITGGHCSMAAVVVRDGVVDDARKHLPDDPLAMTPDSSGLPVSCAAANAALEVIVSEDLAGRAARLGPRLIAGLDRVRAEFPEFVTEVPGQGLMTGARLRNPVVEFALWLRMLRKGVMMGYSTNFAARRPAMRFFPPLIVREEEIDVVVATFAECVTELARKPGWAYDAAQRMAVLQYKLPTWALRGFIGSVTQ